MVDNDPKPKAAVGSVLLYSLEYTQVHTGLCAHTHASGLPTDLRQCVTVRLPSSEESWGESGSKSVSKYDLRHAVMPLCGPQRLCGFKKQIEQTNKVSGTVQGGAAVVY